LEIGRRVGFSREQAGLHYPSDSAISKKIAQIIFAEKLIRFE
jgi:membrane-associated phospholipid phosphatase